MNRKTRILQERWQQSFLVLLAWAMLTAWVALPHTAFASQGQEKAEVSPWSLVNEQGTRDKGQMTNDQTAFTYQGQLKDAAGPVNGAYDLQFILYSAQTGGEKLGSIDIEDLALSNGLFSVRLDFGQTVLEAKEGWLEIGVRPGGSAGPYTVLFPRQKLTPTPYAIFAQHEQWSLIGVPVGFAGVRDKNTDIISLDEKKVSMADIEASLAKLAEKAVTSTKLNEGSMTMPEISPNAVPNGSCNLPLPCSNSMPSNEILLSISNTGSGHGFYASSMGSGLQSGIVGDNLNQSAGGYGVSGYSFGFAGVFGFGKSATSNGVFGNVNNTLGSGVYGRNDGGGYGVAGSSATGFAGVFGSGGQNGVYGITNNRNASGVYGQNDGGGVGVGGFSASGDGVVGRSGSRNGVFGETSSPDPAFTGVWGRNLGAGQGVVGSSANGDGVLGETNSATRVGGFFRNNAGGLALYVDGRARANVLEITGADLSEQFEVNGAMASDSEASPEQVQPGLVVSIDPEAPGKLVISSQAYDHRAAGIISGAGDIKPGVLMNQSGSGPDGSHPVALTGRVYCWADASNGAIEPGDLLTTSATPGHAMKVKNHKKANGAIIGKAMTGLERGKGLVLVLVTLQ
ncbi:MAG: hypothetical protein HY314_14780 [Acidobacteria bacterium]|nr:hypothetical protein [Acidobacteriota bacterium]